MNTTTSRTPLHTAAAAALVLALSGTALTACGSDPAGTSASSSLQMREMASHPADANEIALHSAMRTLWAQHMEWTYATVVAFAAGSAALDPTLARLLRNQTDIGNAIAPFYGPAAGSRLAELLTVHIKEAVPVLTAAKAGDTEALTKAVADWQANARDIADFLASANPHWKRAEMRLMMREHITQTLAYAGNLLAGKHAAAVAAYDVAEAHMSDMADMLSDGIVRQFPKKF